MLLLQFSPGFPPPYRDCQCRSRFPTPPAFSYRFRGFPHLIPPFLFPQFDLSITSFLWGLRRVLARTWRWLLRRSLPPSSPPLLLKEASRFVLQAFFHELHITVTTDFIFSPDPSSALIPHVGAAPPFSSQSPSLFECPRDRAPN